ncbi:hypothetical protein ABPG77_003385 [Micractinium sp. CCAP 211/92]
MQWSFTPSGPLPLKRPSSSSSLPASPLPKRPVLAATAPGGGGAGPAPPLAAGAVDVEAVAQKHGWDLQQRNDWSGDRQVMWLPVAAIRRPLQGSRSNDPEKVAALMKSIEEIGLQEPIDVLEVEGNYWGFSGCHRFEAHQRLGREMILCRVRKATRQILKFHMM